MLIICVGLLAGAVYLFNDLFPKAKPIEHSEIKDVISVDLSCNTPDGTIPMSEQYYEDLIRYISQAKPTRKQALDDYPANRPYYGIEIQTNERQYRYFVYEGIDQVYIESPYEGIYESKTELLDMVLRYFEEG